MIELQLSYKLTEQTFMNLLERYVEQGQEVRKKVMYDGMMRLKHWSQRRRKRGKVW